ncbi:YdeI/OmpD-associated family protein [Arthrobacter cryoconiti]|uniref:YdeI family protein n=1 Tax=Arthrobacter cryoconiti TaxID=748907 RepID=A0ABV8QYQ9_9MICC|nr:hypothetical protein [Arthrobacter cryoconiti]MCC9068398.1 hypothetical protein [Arthrobacter cryoconiti]
MEFTERTLLRSWLEQHHATSTGIFIRIFKKASGIPGVTFAEVLDEGLCFGWSESKRLALDELSYLQRFAPRKTRGTTSIRNLEHARVLIASGLMTQAGLTSLALENLTD